MKKEKLRRATRVIEEITMVTSDTAAEQAAIIQRDSEEEKPVGEACRKAFIGQMVNLRRVYLVPTMETFVVIEEFKMNCPKGYRRGNDR